MGSLGLILLEIAFLAAAHCGGGPPWTVLAAFAILATTRGGIRLGSLAAFLPSLGWLAAARLTENRELFFPFAVYLAVAAMQAHTGRRASLAAGGGIMGGFLVIRLLQGASAVVLGVEAAVTMALLIAADVGLRVTHRMPSRSVLVPAAASGLAYLSLAL
jgi:hypothetical protein